MKKVLIVFLVGFLFVACSSNDPVEPQPRQPRKYTYTPKPANKKKVDYTKLFSTHQRTGNLVWVLCKKNLPPFQKNNLTPLFRTVGAGIGYASRKAKYNDKAGVFIITTENRKYIFFVKQSVILDFKNKRINSDQLFKAIKYKELKNKAQMADKRNIPEATASASASASASVDEEENNHNRQKNYNNNASGNNSVNKARKLYTKPLRIPKRNMVVVTFLKKVDMSQKKLWAAAISLGLSFASETAKYNEYAGVIILSPSGERNVYYVSSSVMWQFKRKQITWKQVVSKIKVQKF